MRSRISNPPNAILRCNNKFPKTRYSWGRRVRVGYYRDISAGSNVFLIATVSFGSVGLSRACLSRSIVTRFLGFCGDVTLIHEKVSRDASTLNYEFHPATRNFGLLEHVKSPNKVLKIFHGIADPANVDLPYKLFLSYRGMENSLCSIQFYCTQKIKS